MRSPQSAPALFAEFPEIKYKLFVIDESETQAGMMVSSATKDKEKALDALKEVANQADHVVLMDAHASEKTDSLMNIISGGEPVHTLINTYKPWDIIDADILEGGNYRKRRSAIDALQLEAIKQNKKIAICSSSKKYCQERKAAISKLFPALQVLLITADDSQHTQDILNNPDMLIAWDVVIFSPAVSVGVSFDLPNHINHVFGVFPNTQYTGDTDDAIQALARIRKPVDKKWIIMLDEDKNIFKNAPYCPKEIAEALGQRGYRILMGLESREETSETAQQLVNLFSVCEHERTYSKNNFNRLFRQQLRDMGLSVSYINIDEIEENQLSNEITDDVKADAVEQEFIARTESPRITEDEAQEIRIKQKYKPWELLDGETDSLKRFQAEKNLMVNFDDYSEGEKRDFIELLDDGAISKCINREIALADKDFTREYMQARKYGLGEKGAFRRDILDDSFNYPLTKKILNYVVPYFDGREYTHNDLKKGALVKFIERNEKEINALRVIALPDNWKSKPALLINYLLDMCGYSHTSHQARPNGKKKEYIFRAVSIAPIDRLIEKRKGQANNWIDSTRALMEIYRDNQTVDSTVFGGASLDADINKLADSDFINEDVIGYKLDVESKNHFYEKLAKVPENDQKKVIENYILIATSPAPESSRFTPQALANLSMIKEAKKYELRE
jgi:hypothetical protein